MSATKLTRTTWSTCVALHQHSVLRGLTYTANRLCSEDEYLAMLDADEVGAVVLCSRGAMLHAALTLVRCPTVPYLRF